MVLSFISTDTDEVFFSTGSTMVRNYKRKQHRCSYGAEKLRDALAAIQGGKPVKAVSREFQVPAKTLRRHRDSKVRNPGEPLLGRYEHALPASVETAIANHVRDMSHRMYGLTTNDVRKLAYDVAVDCKVKHPFNDDKKAAGEDWLRSFLKRQNLSIRLPQATSISRMVGFNKPKVTEFFQVYSEMLQKRSFTANNIYNMDETGITTVQKPSKVVARKGQKSVSKATSAERGQLVTVICAMSAAGNYIPPMFIFPRKNLRDTLMKDASPGAVGHVSDSGWTNESLFHGFLACLL